MDGELIADKEIERPLEPGNPPTQQPFPWLIISLVVVSWAVFLFSLYKNDCPSHTERRKCVLHGCLGRFSFQPFQENTQFGPTVATLVNVGGFKWDFKKERTKKWHILSSIFFHRGIISLTLDTISLLYMGMELEQRFGTGTLAFTPLHAIVESTVPWLVKLFPRSFLVKIGPLYFLSSLGGSLWACLKFKGAIYVGGSSGVCGLTGGAIAEFFINVDMYENKLKRLRSLCLGTAINFTVKLFPGVDVSGNIGGLYLGFLVGFLLLIRRRPESGGYEFKLSGFDPQQLKLKYSRYKRVLWVIALISTFVQFVYSILEYILH